MSSRAVLYSSGIFYGVDNEGKPLSYGTVEFLDTETGVAIYTYSNANRTEVNTNPVLLTASGKASIFLDMRHYNVILRDQYGTIIETLIDFAPGTGGIVGSGTYQGKYTPALGEEYPEDDPDIYGNFWSLATPWTFQTGDLAGQSGLENDVIMFSVNGWVLMELGIDTSLFLKVDGSEPMTDNFDMGLNRCTRMLDAIDDRDAVAFGQLEGFLDDIWEQSDFIDQSEGVASADKPIKTDSQGHLDFSFLEVNLFDYQGEHDPRYEEYPPVAGLTPGDFFTADLPVGTRYEFTTGNLVGKSVKEGDALIYRNDTEWAIIDVYLEPTDYIKRDGSVPMDANLSMGNKKITNLAPATLDNEAVTKAQLDESSVVPVGAIIMWAGAFSNIPDGWALCNGQSGRPDLTDRFILGTNQESQVGDVGGDNTATMPAHTHTMATHSHTINHNHTASTNSTGDHTHTSGAYVYQWGTSAPVGGIISSQIDTGSTTNFWNVPYSGSYTGSAGAHSHTVTVNTVSASSGVGGATATGTSGGSGDNRPAFYKLAFIMKI